MNHPFMHLFLLTCLLFGCTTGEESSQSSEANISQQPLLNTFQPGDSAIPTAGEEAALHKIKLNAIIQKVVFSPEGDKFVSVSNDNIIRLWNLQGKLLAEMRGHSDVIMDVNFSHDSKLITSSSFDKTARVWDLSGNELHVYTGYGGRVQKAKFSPDNKYILSASDDKTARLMPISVEMVLDKINTEKVRGEVWNLKEKDKEVYGIIK